MYPASSDGLNKETDAGVYFFIPAFFALDNFSAHTVILWGKIFQTAEHAYQWRKFFEAAPEVARKVFESGSPEMAKRVADAHKSALPGSWHEGKVLIMEEILRAKAAQHEDVRELLAKTGSRMIAENSPVDSFWGLGPDGKGKNMVGKIWVKIRAEITMPTSA